MKITKIKENLILFTSHVLLGNATLLKTAKRWILVDTLLLPTDTNMIVTYMKENDIVLSYIINTHWHSDHCFGNRILHKPPVKAIAQAGHRRTLELERNMIKPERSMILEKHLVPEPDMVFEQHCSLFDGLFIPDADQQSTTCEIIHAPGHSFDMSYVWCEREGILITGDNVLAGEEGEVLPPYFWWGDIDLLINSLNRIILLNPCWILPGHGNPVKLSYIENYLIYLENLKIRTTEIVQRGGYSGSEQLRDIFMAEIDIQSVWPERGKTRIKLNKTHELNLYQLAIERVKNSG